MSRLPPEQYAFIVLAYALGADPRELALPGDQHSEYLWLADDEIRARRDVHPNTQAYCGL